MSPTSLGGNSSCGNYHARCNTAGLTNKFHPQMISSSDLNRVQNISNHSSIPSKKRTVKKEDLAEYKIIAATLIVDRIKNQLKKSFKPLKSF